MNNLFITMFIKIYHSWFCFSKSEHKRDYLLHKTYNTVSAKIKTDWCDYVKRMLSVTLLLHQQRKFLQISEGWWQWRDCWFCSMTADSFSVRLLTRTASQSSLRCSSVDMEQTITFTQIIKYRERVMCETISKMSELTGRE